LEAALAAQEWDLVVSDYSVPQMNIADALSALRERRLDLPFIVVSGVIGEMAAVQAMKAGASDVIPKGQYTRLIPAIQREMRESEWRRQRRQADARHLHELTLLSKAASAFVGFTQLKQIYPFLGGIIQEASGADYLVLTEYLPQFDAMRIKALLGIEGLLHSVTQMLGIDPSKILLSHKDMTDLERRAFMSGGLARIDEGLYAIANQKIPKVACQGIERLLGIGCFYVMGFCWENKMYGGLTLAFKKGKVLNNQHLVETIVKQASLVIQRLQAEHKMREQAELLDEAHDAILVLNLEHKIVFWNKSAERVYGWSSLEALSRAAEETLAPLAPDTVRDALRQAAASGQWIGELTQSGRHGNTLQIHCRATLVRDDQNQPERILVINTDITEKKQLEARFLRAQRLESLGTLASGIAHDLNNVLTPITMAIHHFKRKCQNEEDLIILGVLQDSATRGANIIKQVLAFGRGIEGNRTPVQIKTILEEVGKIARQTFPKNIAILERISPDLRLIQGDATQLHQVFLNLAINARDAMPDGGTLLLQASNITLDKAFANSHPDARTGPYVLVQVIDTGCGISHGLMEKIFDPFFTTKPTGAGTGLGLSTAMGIVKNHSGFIQAASEPGRGSTFSTYFAALQDDRSEVGEVSELPEFRGSGQLILVVEDEKSVREVMQRTLAANGYQVLTACDGKDALAMFHQHRKKIQLVLTDLSMPQMDGASLIHAIRRLDADLPLILASGMLPTAEETQIKKQGIQGMLLKPFATEKLLWTIHEALTSRKALE
jgi:PAS domain S-box-containing protein